MSVAGVVLLSFLIAVGVLLRQAGHERQALLHNGVSAAAATVNVLDREAEALGNTLRGLSRSPLLDLDDLEPFYQQLLATPRPDGARFVLWTPGGQLLNTSVPFGNALPSMRHLDIRRDRLDRVRHNGLVMSERFQTAIDGRAVVAISLGLQGTARHTERILTVTVPDDHLAKASRDFSAPGWVTFILDPKLQELAGPGRGPGERSGHLPQAVLDGITASERAKPFEVVTDAGAMVVALQRSTISRYTVVSVAPAALVNSPINRAGYQIALAGTVLILAGAGAATRLTRSGGPIDLLRRDAVMRRSELAAANARMSDVLESISDCYFTLDRSYCITEANAAALRWWDHEGTDLVGQSYFETVGRDPLIDSALAGAIGEQLEFRGVLASRHYPGRFIDCRVYPSSEGATVFFVDVTERYEVHQTALRERQLLQACLDALSAHIAVLDDRGAIVSVNDAWRRFAVNRDEQSGFDYGMNVLDSCAQDQQLNINEERVLDGIRGIVRGDRCSFQALYPVSAPDRQRWFQVRARRFMAGAEVRIVVAREDITDIIAAKEEVGELSERLLVLQDEERQRIAAELHDSTAQHLVAVGLSLMQVEAMGLPPAGQRILDGIDRSLEEALRELRVFTYLLHPPGLDKEGLAGSIRYFVDGFADRTGLRVTARIADRVDSLAADRQRALFRIVQEGLANVHRHAGASRAAICLRMTPHEVILSVCDDGHGLRPRRGDAARKVSLGVGIPGMRIRLSQLGGSLKIRTGPNGTVVRASIPRDLIGGLEADAPPAKGLSGWG